MMPSHGADESVGAAGAGKPVPFPPEQSRFLRSVIRYRGNPIARFEEMRRDCPPVAGFRLVGQDMVLVHDPEVIEEILVRQHAAFAKDAFTSGLSAVLGQGLLTSEGDVHRRQRKLVAPSLGATEVVHYVPAMVEQASRYAAGLEPGATLDVSRAMMRLTLDILVSTLFGQAFSDHELVERELEATMRAFRPWPELFRMLLPEWFPLPSRRRLGLARTRLHEIVDRMLTERRAGSGGTDLLSRLVAARDEGEALSDAELRDQVITLFLAGHETTALALGYALRHLAENPRCQGLVEVEIDALPKDRAPRAEELRALPYTHAVFQEVLRLHPPAWVIGRQALKDVVVKGWQIRPGMQVMMPIYTVQRDPRWFEAPEEFRPERFLPGGEVAEGRVPRFAYLPFGAGPRVCVGNHFALLEAMAILVGLVRRVRFELTPGTRLDLAPSVTLRPKSPLTLRVTPR